MSIDVEETSRLHTNRRVSTQKEIMHLVQAFKKHSLKLRCKHPILHSGIYCFKTFKETHLSGLQAMPRW